jgi:hypothetical protein
MQQRGGRKRKERDHEATSKDRDTTMNSASPRGLSVALMRSRGGLLFSYQAEWFQDRLKETKTGRSKGKKDSIIVQ